MATGAGESFLSVDIGREFFRCHAQRLIEQFSQDTPAGLSDDHKVNGGLTVGENIGDLGGLQIGYSAYRIATEGEGMPEIDGFTLSRAEREIGIIG